MRGSRLSLSAFRKLGLDFTKRILLVLLLTVVVLGLYTGWTAYARKHSPVSTSIGLMSYGETGLSVV